MAYGLDPNKPPSCEENSDGLSTGAIAGIIVGAIFGAIILFLLIIKIWKNCNRPKE
jgi:hypothetical protein